MANLTDVKLNAASALVMVCGDLLERLHQIDELTAIVNDKALKTGQANEIVDNNLTGNVDHLTAAQFNAAVTVLEALSTAMTAARRKDLRLTLRAPIQF